MLGIQHDLTTANSGDSVELRARIYDDNETPIGASDIDSVTFTVKSPDEDESDFVGTIESDGAGFLRYINTDQTGVYLWRAKFSIADGGVKSYHDKFNVIDPLETPALTQKAKIAQEVWMRLEDIFDSEYGGPYIRDMTLAYFDASKLERFVGEGMNFINSYPPITNVGLSIFTTPIPSTDPAIIGETEDPDDMIIIVQSTLIAAIRHLMRSYVEQPAPQGANIVWQDRRDYLQRWSQIYQIEEDWFLKSIALWKRSFLNYGKTSMLVHSKAGRIGYGGSSYRARNVARGIW